MPMQRTATLRRNLIAASDTRRPKPHSSLGWDFLGYQCKFARAYWDVHCWVPWGEQGPTFEAFANLLGNPGVGNPAGSSVTISVTISLPLQFLLPLSWALPVPKHEGANSQTSIGDTMVLAPREVTPQTLRQNSGSIDVQPQIMT